MPTTKPCFRVPLTDDIRQFLAGDHGVRTCPQVKSDPGIRFTAHTIDIDYSFEDVKALYSGMLQNAAFGLAGQNQAGWMETLATPEYKEEVAQQLEQSRDHFDNFVFGQAAPSGVVDGSPAEAAAQQALGGQPGLVLGNGHEEAQAKDLAAKLVEGRQVGMLFVEEFPTVLQDDINAYLDPGATEMSPALAKHILTFKNQHTVDLALLLNKAKAANAKVYGINSGDSAVVSGSDPRHHEYRCAVMNETAEKVMKKAIQENPNVKFLAVCGKAHSNTFPGGIPGLAQILNVPAVEMSKTGKLYVKPEDPANQRRPSKEERAFVDQYMQQVVDAYKEATETIQEAEGIDTVELRKEALALADRFKRGGRLNADGDVAGLLTDKAAKDKQNDLILRTARRHTSKAECKTLIEQGLDAALDDLLKTVQANDPHGYQRLVTGHEQKETLLHAAAAAGQAGCLDQLAAHGFDLEATNKEGRTAFMVAAAGGKGAAVKKLSDLGADVNAATSADGKTALHLAAQAGTVPHRLLAAPGLNLNTADASGNTPMRSAAAAGKTDAVGKLQAKGASLDGADPQGQTALHKAIAAGQIAAALDLVQKGANVKALAGGKSPLHLAAEKGDLALLNALMSAGADMNQADADGRTPLHHAVLAGKADLANRLILKGARIDVADADGNSALHLALEKKLDGPVQGLLFRGADPNVRNKQGLSALDVAAQAGGKNYVIAKHVADKGNSADTRTDLAYLGEFLTAARDEYTGRPKPEGAAAALDEREAARLALERVGRLRQRGDLANDTKPEAITRMAKSGAKKKDATDMYTRAEGRQKRLGDVKNLATQDSAAEFDANLVKITQMLDDDPALIHAEPTLLHDACKVGNERLVALLLARGANVLYRNEGGETPLHKSCQRRAYTSDDAMRSPETLARATRSANIAGALLNAVPDANAKQGLLDAQTNLGQTALHLAAYTDHPKVIQDLCQAGARDDIRDPRGWRPIEVAMASTKGDAERALVEHGPHSSAPLVDPNSAATLSTIDVLCLATFCENPAHAAKVRKAYTQLYATEALRPVMDLAALDALRPRVLPKKADGGDEDNANVGGTRFFVAASGTVGNLYDPSKVGPQGAYDQKTNAVLFAGDPTADGNDMTGNIIHEMTHLATRIVYGKDTKPCDNINQQQYIDAIEKDVATATLIEGKNGFEKTAKTILCGRMTGMSYAPRGDGTLLTEFIVGVPQIMAQYGPEGARQIAPELSKIFDGFKDKCEEMKADARFTTVSGRLDNTAVIETLKDLPPRDERPVGAWTMPDKLPKVDQLMKRVEAHYKAHKGVKVLGKDMYGKDRTFCYDTSLYRLDGGEPPDPRRANDLGRPPDPGYDEFVKKMRVVRSALEQSFDPQKLGGAVSQEDLTRLIKETTELAVSKTSKELESAVAGHTASWALGAKKHYLEAQVKQKALMKTDEVAELVVLRAEAATWDRKWGAGDMAVDEGKHNAVVQALKQKLDALPDSDRNTLLKSPEGYINDTTQAVLTGEGKAFYKKTFADAGHVSINKKEWLKKLATL